MEILEKDIFRITMEKWFDLFSVYILFQGSVLFVDCEEKFYAAVLWANKTKVNWWREDERKQHDDEVQMSYD